MIRTALAAALVLLPLGAEAAELVRAHAPVYAYAFNVQSRDVTVIDTATNEVIETRPLDASVRWLSNEQDFWDGRHIWTYDLVQGQVHLVAIDPVAMRVDKRLEIGKGPAHSVQLTPDRKHVLVNAAGDNFIAVVERESLSIERRLLTGDFPCDIDFSSERGLGYVPERDQDSVAAFDLESFEIVERTTFPQGSKPHMLRVAPEGESVWVQTARDGTNDVLDPGTLERRNSTQLGQVPVTNAWTPDGREVYLTHLRDGFVSVLDAASYEERGRIQLGAGSANVAFRPDGQFAYVTLPGADAVAVVDTARREVVERLPTGRQPWGLIVMSPPEG